VTRIVAALALTICCCFPAGCGAADPEGQASVITFGTTRSGRTIVTASVEAAIRLAGIYDFDVAEMPVQLHIFDATGDAVFIVARLPGSFGGRVPLTGPRSSSSSCADRLRETV